MELPAFSVTWDYRCPFARNAHEHVIAALADGAPYHVSFVPFSLSQVHVADGDPPVWENPEAAGDLLALRAGVVARDRFPAQFLDAHRELFAARHDLGGDLRDPGVIGAALTRAGLDPAPVLAHAQEPWTLDLVRQEHEDAVRTHAVFGVPTFVVGERAAFARIMTRPEGDAHRARRTVEQVVELVSDHADLNELKHTTVGR